MRGHRRDRPTHPGPHLVVALGGTVVATATADVNADVNLEIRLPLPALPLGPGPLYPLDSYGPQADDNAVLRWGEQTLSAIRALLNLFPARTSDFRGLMSAMGYDPDNASTDPASPTGIGNQAAAAVLAFRANDGSNQANGYADTTGYVPVNTPTRSTTRSAGSRCASSTPAATPWSRST
jgi:hypothetical protein